MNKYFLIILFLVPFIAFGQNDDKIFDFTKGTDSLQNLLLSNIKMPIFKSDLADFMRGNIKYPKSGIKKGIEGTVYV
ncbi:hypothetical protein MYP_2585 [Sporocytophaga myxococcoides]|uniref:TonB C-terminal domain-containing protein n=1 Tax=Sporocytophaga myxococcoides TaxID=153721 RepID=A0A098LEL6_9BACT|nr:hypothetical protein [Sporocytophaga myxococcoides]GAL85356.1 hypothetical protein MYP_2585 [Sporocytophaga myxococcoides]